MIVLVLAGFLAFVLIEGFFSGSEIAVVSCDKIRIKQKAAEGHTGAQLVLAWSHNPGSLFGTTLVGTNLAVVLNTVFVTSVILAADLPHAEAVATALLGPAVLVLGEILPKSIFQAYATDIALRVAVPLKVASWILYPIHRLAHAYGRWFGQTKDTPRITKDELLILLGRRGGDVKDAERAMIRRVFRFSKDRVRDAMVPLVEVAALPENATVGQAVNLILRTGHTRMPVYRARIDNVVGILRAYDLVDQIEAPNQPIRPFMRKALYVPETQPLVSLLQALSERRLTVATVVDEFGGTVGFVTREDIVEELVGEIEDEYDEARRRRWVERDGATVIDARTDIELVNEVLGLNLPWSDNYETLAGFVLEQCGRVPGPGEELRYQGLLFRVTKSTPTQVKEVEVRRVV